jgi:nitrous-oxide reductase
MKLLLDFPTFGEPHYAQAMPASLIKDKQVKFYKIAENKHPYATKGEAESKVVRQGNKVHVYMTSIRSHFAPDNIEGIKVGDEVYFHVTNLEQDWDVPHGFAIKGAQNAELLIMPGETCTLKWVPKKQECSQCIVQTSVLHFTKKCKVMLEFHQLEVLHPYLQP